MALPEKVRGVFLARGLSTTPPYYIAKTFVTPKFSRIPPKRVNILMKSKDFEWQEKFRKFSLHQTQAIERIKKIQPNMLEHDINSKKKFQVQSILPEMKVYYNAYNDYFAVVHAAKKKVTLDVDKAITDNISSNTKLIKENTFIINDEIKNKITYLQKNDPHCIWTSRALSSQFRIPVEAIMQQTPPTEAQKEATRYYRIFQSKLSTIDKVQHKVYLEKKRYVAFEEMKAAFENPVSNTFER